MVWGRSLLAVMLDARTLLDALLCRTCMLAHIMLTLPTPVVSVCSGLCVAGNNRKCCRTSFIVSQACMPHLLDRPQSSYTIITGRMGEECMKTDEAVLTIANAATGATVRGAELRDAGVLARANELRIGAVIRRDREVAGGGASAAWMLSDALSALAADACECAAV